MKIKFRIIVKETNKIIEFKDIHFTGEYNTLFFEREIINNDYSDLPGAYKIDLYNNWRDIYTLQITSNDGICWYPVE